MIPEQRIATKSFNASILQPDSRNAVPLTEDYETGGIALSDASQGFLVKNWKVEVINNSEIWISPEDEPENTKLVLTDVNITEVTFSFDQLMREVVGYVASGVTKIWYHDSVESAYISKSIPGASSPFAALDDKRETAFFMAENDVIIFYLKDLSLMCRLQRDRYDIEYVLHTDIPGAAKRIHKAGMDSKYRMHVEIQLRENEFGV